MSGNDNTNKSNTITDPMDRDSVSSSASGLGNNAGKATKGEHSAGSDDSNRDSQAVYHDYSRDRSMLMSSEEPRESVQTFPMKLHSILSNPEFSNIVSWLPHGRAFRILQHKAFEEKVIPLYFRHGRYSSFARQVNGWGFKRIAHGPDYNSYYHELFLRGIPRLCEKMKRLSGKDEKKNEESSDSPAPDFYALSRQNPLPEDNDDIQATGGLESNAGEAARTGNGGYGFTAGGLGDLASLLRSQAGGTNGGSARDVLGGLVLQALELRRNEIMQRLSSLVAEGFVSSLSQSQSSGTDPLSSIMALLSAQQHASVPASTPGNIGDLVANLLHNGGNASSAARQPAASAGFQGLQHLANNAANSQAASGVDILALLRQQQEYQQSKPPAQPPSQPSAPAATPDLQQQLMNNPSTAALFQQLQGTLLGNGSSSAQAPAPQIYSGNPSQLSQGQGGGQNGALQFRSAMGVPSSETRAMSETHNVSNGTRAGFQLPPGADIDSLLSSGPNALANLASLLQNQRGSNGAGPPPAGSSSMSQHNESQNSSPQLPVANGHAPANRSPQPNSNPGGLPATIASLLGQVQQTRGGQLPTNNNTAALLSQLGQQQNRWNAPEGQDQMMMRQQQQQHPGMSQVSQIQALLGQQQQGTDWQSLLDQANHTSQGVNIRSQLQRQQQISDQSGLLGLQNQLMGGGNLSIEQLQLAALLGLGSQGSK